MCFFVEGTIFWLNKTQYPFLGQLSGPLGVSFSHFQRDDQVLPSWGTLGLGLLACEVPSCATLGFTGFTFSCFLATSGLEGIMRVH